MTTLDVVYLADPAFPGGTSTALIHELAAARRAGLAVGLKPVSTARLARHRPPHPGVLEAMCRHGVQVLPATSRVRARIALICHPYLLDAPLQQPLGVEAGLTALVAHHPPVDRHGTEQYRLDNLLLEGKRRLGGEVVILPISQTIRQVFAQIGRGGLLWDENWPNLIDPDQLTVADTGRQASRLVIGRHSRPDLLKWPTSETAALVYPDDPAFEFHMLGVGPQIIEAFSPWPDNWVAHPFRIGATPAFLRELQVYAYYHAPRWIEAFGYNVLEALVAGLPAVLPPHLRENFGEAALYAEPAAATAQYDLLRSPELRQSQGDLGRRLAIERHGLDSYGPRLKRLLRHAGLAAGDGAGSQTGAGTPAVAAPDSIAVPKDPRAIAARHAGLIATEGGETNRPPTAPAVVRIRGDRPERVLAITSNGVGVGHLSRQLAIARSQELGIETVFFSLSKAVIFAEQAGFAAEYRAFHRQIGADSGRWNAWFQHELEEAIRMYRPHAVVFDGNMPYQGMINAFSLLRGAARIWVRRGLWRKPDPVALQRAAFFDQIIEPGDVAAAQAPGHERQGGFVEEVPPILSVPPADCPSRQMARRLLDLPQEAEIVLMQLGAGSNFDMGPARDLALDLLLSSPGRHVVEVLSPARIKTGERRGPNHHLLTLYPIFHFHRAFDYVISACGYNSFHEIIAGRLPALLVPNTASEMDLQECRADYATHCGWALSAAADNLYGLAPALQRLIADTALREQMRAAMTAANPDMGGARIAAERIALAMRSVRAIRA